MKKKIITLLTVCMMSVTAMFAMGIGIQGGSDVANTGTGNGSVDITFKLDSNPLIFAVGLNSFDPLSIGLSGDYWMVNENIAGPINYYVGVGGFAHIYISDYYTGLSLGPRVPVGLNMFFAENVLEVYIQVAPGYAFNIAKNVSSGFVCPVNFGLRAWL